jgi:hypothetical protein
MLADTAAIENPGLRAKIAESAALLQRNRQLVALHTELPSDWRGLDSLRHREPDWDRLLGMARDNRFKSLVPGLERAREAARSPTLFEL